MLNKIGPTELASWIVATHDGTWRLVWRGTPVDRSFATRDAAWSHLEACEDAGEIVL